MSSPVLHHTHKDRRCPIFPKEFDHALDSEVTSMALQDSDGLPLVRVQMNRKRRLLVVDDEPSIVATLCLIFEDRGFEVVTACSAGDAKRKLLADGEFDLVLTDMTMETQLAGYEVLEAADRRQSKPQVLILTGYPNLVADWKKKGASALLVKPASVAELLQIVDSLLKAA